MTPLLVALALALPPQTPRDGPNATLVDCVAAQAGDDAITYSELSRANERLFKSRPVSTPEEAQKLWLLGLRDLLTERLEAQAGADMGLDPAQIDQQIHLILEQEREKVGLASYTEKLLAEGLDALSAEGERARQLYGILWRRSKLGFSVAGRRPAFDSFVRPGELRNFFEENRSALSPKRVRLRVLTVSSAAAGGPEQARATCEEARARVLAGEELGALVAEFGAEFRDTRGLTPYLLVAALPEALRSFAENSPVGELSPVLPVVKPSAGTEPLAYQVVEMAEREDGEEPDFEQPEFQRQLREFYTRERSNRALERERALLRSRAYSWVHPRLRGSPPPGAPAPR